MTYAIESFIDFCDDYQIADESDVNLTLYQKPKLHDKYYKYDTNLKIYWNIPVEIHSKTEINEGNRDSIESEVSLFIDKIVKDGDRQLIKILSKFTVYPNGVRNTTDLVKFTKKLSNVMVIEYTDFGMVGILILNEYESPFYEAFYDGHQYNITIENNGNNLYYGDNGLTS